MKVLTNCNSSESPLSISPVWRVLFAGRLSSEDISLKTVSSMEALHSSGPKADFSGPDLHERCLEWTREVKLILNGPMHEMNRDVKVSFVKLWAGKAGRQHLKAKKAAAEATAEQLADPEWILDEFVTWTKPKSNELIAALDLRRLQQGTLSLTKFVHRVIILCERCNFPEESKKRMLRDTFVFGLNSKEAKFLCFQKGSELTFKEAVEFAENQEHVEAEVKRHFNMDRQGHQRSK